MCHRFLWAEELQKQPRGDSAYDEEGNAIEVISAKSLSSEFEIYFVVTVRNVHRLIFILSSIENISDISCLNSIQRSKVEQIR